MTNRPVEMSDVALMPRCSGAERGAALPLVTVDDLSIYFQSRRGTVHAVDGASFEIGVGQTVGLVGETGCGKSVTARSFLGLVPSPPAVHAGGRIVFRPRQECPSCHASDCQGGGQAEYDLTKLTPREFRKVRGEQIAMIFQDPSLALNPVLTIGQQVAEVFHQHRAEMMLADAGLSTDDPLLRRAASDRSSRLERAVLAAPGLRRRRNRLQKVVDEYVAQALAETRIANPRKIMNSYPHELSGGMKQRVMIAQALACAPDLLIADEPTTALDVTIQAHILDLIHELQERHHTAVLYISHDLSLVRDVCDQVVVMYAGQVVEQGPTTRLFDNPLHPYARGLLGAVPSGGQPRGGLSAIEGMVPELVNPSSQCRFHTRCAHASAVCAAHTPTLTAHDPPDHRAACFLYEHAETLGLPAEDMPSRNRSAS
ncbi:peptide/nickel transport system ATP-binding protein/oligopeptide transport system ATP-binding protein [Sinosporangium album]|uniref:Nickel import system ATP-binding protein NikD n=1 Tax=Sinosporangium album TaxID=504805 RepID=A0A1G8BIJ1_9ACTN|nr:ABC transporter ATP-binding protein [Sinosporangium album]SDH33035.1 peptide/nickel transport system ATP-binding protein/oligopeptide transport system ATP-binding protein [Sinosporangium album]